MPTTQVLLDDGTGTFPIDISSRVDMSSGAGVNISSYGRATEASTADAATMSLTLDNRDGAFTGGGTGFGLGSFGVVPFGGGAGYDITPDKTRIRVKVTQGATTVNRFTGRIATSDLDLGFGLGVSNVELTAADVLADLSRRVMRSMLEEEVLTESGLLAYYTLAEAAGATSAGDTSGQQAAPLALGGSGAAVTFGSGVGPTDGLTAATFYGGQYLTGGPSYIAAGIVVEVWFTSTTDGDFVTFYGNASTSYTQVAAGINTSGKLDVRLTQPSGQTFVAHTATVTDGGLHHAVFNIGDTGATIYLDGGAPVTGSFSFANPGIVTNGMRVGQGFNGGMSHLAFYTGLSSARVTAHHTVGSGALETTAARLARIGSYVGVNTVTTSGMSGQLMPGQVTSDKYALDALQEIAQAEGGVLFSNGNGDLVLQGRGYRAAKTTATLTLNADDVAVGARVPWDTQQFTDQVTVTRTNGATQLVGVNRQPRYPSSLEVLVDTDAAALARGQWELAKHSTTSPRMPTTNLLPRGSANAEAILTLDIGDRVAFSGLPSQMYGDAGDQVYEGRTETLTQDDWTITTNLVPWSQFTALVLDDPTYGALDAYPISY